MQIRIDFHVHSIASPDGRLTVDEIRSRAVEAGLNGVAVCDHNVCTPLPEEDGFLWIHSVECSTEKGHLLGLFYTGEVPSGTFSERVEAIRRAGGIAIVAHPAEREADFDFDAAARETDGWEIFNGRATRHNAAANDLAKEAAQAHGVIVTAGSDAHLGCEIGGTCVTLEAEELTADAVKAALQRGVCRIDGRESAARYTAASQWSRRRKEKAPVRQYCSWAASAVLCLLHDLTHRRKTVQYEYRKENGLCH